MNDNNLDKELLIPFPGEEEGLKDGGQIGAWMKGWERGYTDSLLDLSNNEKKMALEGWYSCMIAMGMIPKNEDLYFKAKEMFLSMYNISDTEVDADKNLSQIKDEYYLLKSKSN